MYRWLRAIWRMCFGWIGSKADALQENEHVMSATYDASIEKGQERYKRTKESIARLIGIEETKVQKVKNMTAEVETLEQVKAGATNMAKAVVAKLKKEGKTQQEIENHPEYLKCMAGFQDAASSLEDREKQIEDTEKEIAESKVELARLKADLQSMQRRNQKLGQEKEEAIADVQIAKDKEAAVEGLQGIGVDTTDKDLAGARKARQNAKNRARVATEIAGTDATSAQNEFLQFAQSTKAHSEFASLVGLDTEDKEEAAPEKKNLDPAKLPES